MAFSLEFVNSFKYDNIEAIGFDKSTRNLFLVQASVVSFQPFTPSTTIEQFTPNGQALPSSSFKPKELFSVAGIDVLENGNLLVVSPVDNRVVEYTRSGQLVDGGIDFSNSILDYSATKSGEDLVLNPKTGSIYIGNGNGSQVYEFNRQGQLISTLDLSGVLPTGRYKGVAIDPITSNFFLSVDEVGDAATDNKIYEVTPSGQILTTIDIKALTGFADPEALAIDPATRTLYIGFDGDNAQGANVYLPNRNWVAAYKLEIDSFAGDTGLNDVTTGDATANSFLGGIGNDTLSGLQGADILDGGLDNDVLDGGDDSDQLLGGAGNDSCAGGSGGDYLGGGVGDDTLFGGDSNDNIVGGAGNDTINGNTGNDIINGNDGNDLVRGGRGEDYITGDAGNDTIYGDEGFDTINGGAGDDSILGESGEDVLSGELGADTLTGGASKDIFLLAAGTGTDVITDFTVGVDLIGLTGGLTYDKLTFTQDVTNNVTSAQIRSDSTGEILASLTGISPTLITRSMFTSL